MLPINGSTIRGATRPDRNDLGLPTKNKLCVRIPTRRKKERREIVKTSSSRLRLRRPYTVRGDDVHHADWTDILQIWKRKVGRPITTVRGS